MIDDLSDLELTENIKNGIDVNNCLKELQERHSGIFYKKANAYSGIMEIEDLKENPLSFFSRQILRSSSLFFLLKISIILLNLILFSNIFQI